MAVDLRLACATAAPRADAVALKHAVPAAAEAGDPEPVGLQLATDVVNAAEIEP